MKSTTSLKPSNSIVRMKKDFIKVYNDILDKDTCEFLALTLDTSKGKEFIDIGPMKFTQVNLNGHHKNMVPLLISSVRQVVSLYKKDVEETNWFPKNTLALEEFRVKCYTSNKGDHFDTHVDVGDHSSARRYLAFLFYLNDDFEGGQTKFNNKHIQPKTGSVLVFPPTWQYPHSGLPPLTGKKYIMSTYLHYT